jgi:hypothetical protein
MSELRSMTDDTAQLEETLRRLYAVVEAPPPLARWTVDQSMVRRTRPVVAAGPTGQVRRHIARVWVAAGLAVLVGVNLAAFQFSPVYRNALADAPVFGPVTVNLLRNLGLGSSTTGTASPVLPGVTPLAGSAEANGVRLELVAGYADTIRTILILKSPNGLVPFGMGVGGVDEMRLTDEFGHSYQGWASNDGNGQLILGFAPLVAGQGADRLTLVIPAMYGSGPLVHVPGYPAGTKGEYPGPFVAGPWTLTFDLSAAAGQRLAVPAPQTIDGTTYAITDVRKSGPFVDVQWSVSGRSVDAMVAANSSRSGMPSPSGNPDTQYNFGSAELYSPSGSRIPVQSGNGTLAGPTFRVIHVDYLYRLEQPGTYRLVIGSNPSVTFVIKVN